MPRAGALEIAEKALREVDIMLTIPAAEYVPAIADALLVIGAALDEIERSKGR